MKPQEPQERLTDRIAWRINEWCELTNTSRPTAWRQAKSGKLRLAYVDKTPYVTRAEAMSQTATSPGDCGPEARQVSSSADRRDRPSKEAKRQQVDCRNHALTVFDGAVRVGSLVDRAGTFYAYDVEGRHLGAFADLRAASRAIPRAPSP
jgi:hypothetical protein